jgi:hypothetical protein
VLVLPCVHVFCRACSSILLAQIPAPEKLRLVLLFALRYERDGKMQVGKLLEMLGDERSSVRMRIPPLASASR